VLDPSFYKEEAQIQRRGSAQNLRTEIESIQRRSQERESGIIVRVGVDGLGII